MRIVTVVAVLWLVVSLASMAHSYDIVHVPGSSEVPATPGALHSADGPATVWLPADPSQLAECIRVAKRDSGPGPVIVGSPPPALVGNWYRVTLTMQGDSVEVCPDIDRYLVLGWPSHITHRPHRTFGAGYVGNPGKSLTERCTYKLRHSDRGAVVRMSLVYAACHGAIILPSRDEIRAPGMCGYSCGWRVEVQAVNVAGGWAVVVQAQDGARINGRPYLVLDRDGLVCLDSDGTAWYTCGESTH